MNIKKGDTVAIMTGEDKANKGKLKKGKVLTVFPKENKIIVEGINMVTKHKKAKSASDPGGKINQEAAFDASNAMVVCPSCGKPARIGYQILGDGTKLRVCKKCGEPFKK
ncbi:MAG: 50S ribosomal protein L24 [Eubacteriales bacterium]